MERPQMTDLFVAFALGFASAGTIVTALAFYVMRDTFDRTHGDTKCSD